MCYEYRCIFPSMFVAPKESMYTGAKKQPGLYKKLRVVYHYTMILHSSTHPTSTEVCGSNPVGWLYLVGHLLLAPATTAYIRLRSRLGQDVVSTHKRVVGGRPWLLDHEETHT